MIGLRKRLGESVRVFQDVFRNPNLRRLQLAWGGAVVGQWAYGVALAVYAFEKGGAGAVALTWIIRMIPGALVAPFAGVVADRFRRDRVMVASDLARVVALGLAAVCIWVDAPAGLVYALAALVTVASTPFRAAEAALLPAVSDTPEQLTAANVASSSIESVGFFVGPALAGLLLSVTTPAPVFAITAGAFLWSALCIARVEGPAKPPAEEAHRASIVGEIFAGFRAIAEGRQLRLLVGLLCAVTLVGGVFQVLVVKTAIDLLHMGNSGVGYLNSAYGIGAFVGGIVGLGVVGVRRLSIPFLVGLVLACIPLAAVGVWPRTAVGLVVLGVVGLGSTLFDISGYTLLQRVVSDDVLARVFGVLQMLWLGTIGIGALIAPPLINGVGTRWTLVIVGCALPTLVALVGWRFVQIDAEAAAPANVGLLRTVPIFAPLPGAALEHVAGRLIPLEFLPGEEIIRQGDPGDRFYLVVEGEVDVQVDGRPAPPLKPGDYFGEIALLRDVPRTATVIAHTPVTLYALEREDFLGAVTGHAPSAKAAEAIVGSRLGRARPAEG